MDEREIDRKKPPRKNPSPRKRPPAPDMTALVGFDPSIEIKQEPLEEDQVLVASTSINPDVTDITIKSPDKSVTKKEHRKRRRSKSSKRGKVSKEGEPQEDHSQDLTEEQKILEQLQKTKSRTKRSKSRDKKSRKSQKDKLKSISSNDAEATSVPPEGNSQTSPNKESKNSSTRKRHLSKDKKKKDSAKSSSKKKDKSRKKDKDPGKIKKSSKDKDSKHSKKRSKGKKRKLEGDTEEPVVKKIKTEPPDIENQTGDVTEPNPLSTRTDGNVIRSDEVTGFIESPFDTVPCVDSEKTGNISQTESTKTESEAVAISIDNDSLQTLKNSSESVDSVTQDASSDARKESVNSPESEIVSNVSKTLISIPEETMDSANYPENAKISKPTPGVVHNDSEQTVMINTDRQPETAKSPTKKRNRKKSVTMDPQLDETSRGGSSRASSRGSSRSGSRCSSRGRSRSGSRGGSRDSSRSGSMGGSRGSSKSGSRGGSRAQSRSGSPLPVSHGIQGLEDIRLLTEQLTCLNRDSDHLNTHIYRKPTPRKRKRRSNEKGKRFESTPRTKTPSKSTKSPWKTFKLRITPGKSRTPVRTPAKTPRRTPLRGLDTPKSTPESLCSPQSVGSASSAKRTPSRASIKRRLYSSLRSPEIDDTSMCSTDISVLAESDSSPERTAILVETPKRKLLTPKRKQLTPKRQLLSGAKPNDPKSPGLVNPGTPVASTSRKLLLPKALDHESLISSDDEGDQLDIALDHSDVNDSVDRNLDEASQKLEFTTKNVRSLLHQLITNEHVVDMVRNTLQEDGLESQLKEAIFEPRMTRSKVKEAMDKGDVPLPWALSPIKPFNVKKLSAPHFLEMSFSDNEQDDEYNPTPEEIEHADDDESVYSSHASDIGSPAPSSQFSLISALSPSCSVTSETMDRNEAPLTPTSMGPPSGIPLRMRQDQSEADSLKTEDEVTIALRTRSKLPLTDKALEEIESNFVAPDITPDMYDTADSYMYDEDWNNFLSSLAGSKDLNDTSDTVDDNDDPEYNFFAEASTVPLDKEEVRSDKAVKIPKKELDELMSELFEAYGSPEPEPMDENAEDTQDSQSQSEAPSNAASPHPSSPGDTTHTPGGSTEQQPSQEVSGLQSQPTDGDKEEASEDSDKDVIYPFRVPPLNLTPELASLVASDIMRIRLSEDKDDTRGDLDAPGDPDGCLGLVPTGDIETGSLTGQGIPKLSNIEITQLQDQMRKHVQLLAQTYVQSAVGTAPAVKSVNGLSKQLLTELKVIGEKRKPLHGQSFFHPVNLKEAIKVCEKDFTPKEPANEQVLEKHMRSKVMTKKAFVQYGLTYEQMEVFAKSKVFLFPQMLPEFMLVGDVDGKPKRRLAFTDAEDNLLAMGFDQFHHLEKKYNYINRLMLPTKQRDQIRFRHKNLKARSTCNALNFWYKNKSLPDFVRYYELEEEEDIRPPSARDPDLLPNWFSAYLRAKRDLQGQKLANAVEVDEDSDPETPTGPSFSVGAPGRDGKKKSHAGRKAKRALLNEPRPITPKPLVIGTSTLVEGVRGNSQNPRTGENEMEQQVMDRLLSAIEVQGMPEIGDEPLVTTESHPSQDPPMIMDSIPIMSNGEQVMILTPSQLKDLGFDVSVVGGEPPDGTSTPLKTSQGAMILSGNQCTPITAPPTMFPSTPCTLITAIPGTPCTPITAIPGTPCTPISSILGTPCSSVISVQSTPISSHILTPILSNSEVIVSTPTESHSFGSHNNTVISIADQPPSSRGDSAKKSLISHAFSAATGISLEELDKFVSDQPDPTDHDMDEIDLGVRKLDDNEINRSNVNVMENIEKVEGNATQDQMPNIKDTIEQLSANPSNDILPTMDKQTDSISANAITSKPDDTPRDDKTASENKNNEVQALAPSSPERPCTPPNICTPPVPGIVALPEDTPTKSAIQMMAELAQLLSPPDKASALDWPHQKRPSLSPKKSPRSPQKSPLRPILPRENHSPSRISSDFHKKQLKGRPNRSHLRKDLNEHVRAIAPKGFIPYMPVISPVKMAAANIAAKARHKRVAGSTALRRLRPLFKKPEEERPPTEMDCGDDEDSGDGMVRQWLFTDEGSDGDDALNDSQDDLEDEEVDEDEDRLAELMAASTTVRGELKPSIGDQKPNKDKGLAAQKREALLELLAPDLIENDPKRDERDTAFAQSYLIKVRTALQDKPEYYERFLKLLYDFGCSERTPVELYQDIQEVLSGHPTLLSDFAGFLLPDQAKVCGCLMENLEFRKAREFLRKLEVHFAKQPNQLQRVIKLFATWQSQPQRDPSDLLTSVKPLLKGQPLLLDDFTRFFENEKPPASCRTSFEEVVLPDSDEDSPHEPDDFEEVEFPEGDDDDELYGTKLCRCICHDRPEKSYNQRRSHCRSCAIRVVRGRVYLQTSENNVYMVGPSVEPPASPPDGSVGGDSPIHDRPMSGDDDLIENIPPVIIKKKKHKPFKVKFPRRLKRPNGPESPSKPSTSNQDSTDALDQKLDTDNDEDLPETAGNYSPSALSPSVLSGEEALLSPDHLDGRTGSGQEVSGPTDFSLLRQEIKKGDLSSLHAKNKENMGSADSESCDSSISDLADCEGSDDGEGSSPKPEDEGLSPKPGTSSSPPGNSADQRNRRESVTQADSDAEGSSHAGELDSDDDSGPEWTREEDRQILEVCKRDGTGTNTFQALADTFGNRTADQVTNRFMVMMQMLTEDEDATEASEGEGEE